MFIFQKCFLSILNKNCSGELRIVWKYGLVNFKYTYIKLQLEYKLILKNVFSISWINFNLLTKITDIDDLLRFIQKLVAINKYYSIPHHRDSSTIISHHRDSSTIIPHHRDSSTIIPHHRDSSTIIPHHRDSSNI